LPEEKDSHVAEAIKKEYTFRDLINTVIAKTFSLDVKCKRLYIDMNSVVSIIFHDEDSIFSDSVKLDIYKLFEKLLERYINKGTKVYIMFTLEKSRHHVEIYPDWCKKRYERVNIKRCEYITSLIKSLKEFSLTKENSQIRIINTRDIHPSIVVKYLETSHQNRKSDEAAILSKDPLFQLLGMKHLIVYTGSRYVYLGDPDKELFTDNLTEDELPNLDKMAPLYLCLRGDKRNEFPGLPKFGKVTTIKYLNQHKMEILTGVYGKLEEHFTKYLKLFDLSYIYDNVDKKILEDIIKKSEEGTKKEE